jgi:hypothetical protein
MISFLDFLTFILRNKLNNVSFCRFTGSKNNWKIGDPVHQGHYYLLAEALAAQVEDEV